jgi:putative hemolysin
LDAEGDPNSLIQLASLGVGESAVLIIFLLLLNAFFAMAEIALVSVRKTRIKQLVEEGVPHARSVQKLLEDPTRFLSTIQIGVTLVGFFASAAGAVTFAKPLGDLFARTPITAVADNAYGIAVVLVTLVIGFLSLTIGEISPKSLALKHAERLSLWVAEPLLLLSYIMSPLVKITTIASNALVKPFGGTASFAPPIMTEEELKMLVEAGEEEGVLEEEEKEMIHSIFEFTDTVVRKVMVPRIDIKAVEVNEPISELIKLIVTAGHSRIPVYEESIDNIVGIVHAKDVLRAVYENGKRVTIRELMRPPYVIPENKMVDELLAEFKRNKIQMAIVVDEYGGTAGLVTIEDLLEEIVGDIMDEYDVEEPLVEVIDENTRIVDARMPIDEINEDMGLSLPEEEFDTIGGLVFGLLGKQPQEGDHVTYNSVDLIVEKTDGRRIEKVKIIRREEPTLLEEAENKVEE